MTAARPSLIYTVSNIKNPVVVTAASTTISAQHMDSSNTVIDQTTIGTSSAIVAATLTAAVTSGFSAATATYDFSFNLAQKADTTDKFTLTFPSGFTFNGSPVISLYTHAQKDLPQKSHNVAAH